MPVRVLTKSENAILNLLHPFQRVPMERFMREQEEIIGRLRHERESRQLGSVYHYTRDQAALNGICGGGLWLSDYIGDLNDKREINHGVDVGLNVLRLACEELPLTERLQVFRMAINKKVARGLSHYFAAYVLSCSVDRDSPFMWKRYGVQGRGYCMEFESTVLDQAFTRYTRANRMEACGSYEVIYDDVRLRSIMTEYVRNALAAVVAIGDFPHMRDAATIALNEIATNLLFAIIFTALYFKDPSTEPALNWQAEHEYRFLVMTLADNRLPGIQYRYTEDGRRIPYYVFDWNSHPHALNSVLIGPLKDETEGRQIVGTALECSGLSVPILKSTVGL